MPFLIHSYQRHEAFCLTSIWYREVGISLLAFPRRLVVCVLPAIFHIVPSDKSLTYSLMRWVELDVGRLLVPSLLFRFSGTLWLVPRPSFVEEILF